MSGSGKSSSLNFLAYHHNFFKNCKIHWIWTQHRRFKTEMIYDYGLVVVDEIVSPMQIPAIRSLLRNNLRVAVASHLHPLWFRLFFPFVPSESFCTDSSNQKLFSYLNRLGIPHTNSSIEKYSRMFGSNYVDLQCILESASGQSFEDALQYWLKFNKFSVEKLEEWTSSLPRLNFD